MASLPYYIQPIRGLVLESNPSLRPRSQNADRTYCVNTTPPPPCGPYSTFTTTATHEQRRDDLRDREAGGGTSNGASLTNVHNGAVQCVCVMQYVCDTREGEMKLTYSACSWQGV